MEAASESMSPSPNVPSDLDDVPMEKMRAMQALVARRLAFYAQLNSVIINRCAYRSLAVRPSEELSDAMSPSPMDLEEAERLERNARQHLEQGELQAAAAALSRVLVMLPEPPANVCSASAPE